MFSVNFFRYSAVKVNGTRLYDYGYKKLDTKDLIIPKRYVQIKEIKLINYSKEEFEIVMRCSKGTYVRSVVDILGKKADSLAHTSYLMRSNLGQFDLSMARHPDQFRDMDFLIKHVDDCNSHYKNRNTTTKESTI